MAKLTEFDTAARIKEVIYQIAGRAIDDVYPRPRYATVTAVNHAAGRVTLVYPDDATTFSLPTMMIAPEVGGIVRVAGQEGTRFVDEILTGSVRVRGALNVTGALGVTGALTVPGITGSGRIDLTVAASEALRFIGDASFISFYNAGSANRRGYLQGNTGGVILSSEGGVLSLAGVGGINLIGGRTDFGGYAITGVGGFVINGYTGSTGVIGTRIVLTDSSGYIYTNYLNSTANVAGGWPGYVGGMTSGDNFLRWFDMSGKLLAPYGDYSAGTWTDAAYRSNGYTQSAYSMYSQGYTATYMRFYGPFGRIDFVDSVGGYYTIGAAAYALPSSIKTKENVEMHLDDPLLQEFFWVKSAKYDRKDMHPMTLRPPERFRDVNKRWMAKGKQPLKVQDSTVEHVLHDCDIDPCPGTKDEPCMAMRNNRSAHGLIAEDLWERFPEAVSLDGDGKPNGLFLEMTSGLAMGGVAALTREVVKLQMRVAELEGAQ